MKNPQLLLATVHWISLVILIWLLILGLVPLGGIQVIALVFFFMVALFSTVHRESSRPKAGSYEQTHKN